MRCVQTQVCCDSCVIVLLHSVDGGGCVWRVFSCRQENFTGLFSGGKCQSDLCNAAFATLWVFEEEKKKDPGVL